MDYKGEAYGWSEKHKNHDVIALNLKKHKNSKELRDTIQHEANHLADWKASEKKIKARTARQTGIPSSYWDKS